MTRTAEMMDPHQVPHRTLAQDLAQFHSARRRCGSATRRRASSSPYAASPFSAGLLRISNEKAKSTLTRHFLLMTATPHNGKEADFQLFMALLDGDRFEGRFRDGVHVADVSDLMRRMVKENLLKFDGTPLFPERIAYTVPYKLSDAEARLYRAVTDYVREEHRYSAIKKAGDYISLSGAYEFRSDCLSNASQPMHGITSFTVGALYTSLRSKWLVLGNSP